MKYIKRFVLLLLASWLCSVILKGFFGISTAFSSLWSRARFFALVPASGKSSICHWSTQIKLGENIKIGEHVTIGPYGVLGAKSPISIGDHVRIARGVVLETGGLNFDARPPFPHVSKPIVIEDGVCIFSNAVVVGGVTIGKYSVIGAACVINRDVPPFTVISQAHRVEAERRPSIKRKLSPSDLGET